MIIVRYTILLLGLLFGCLNLLAKNGSNQLGFDWKPNEYPDIVYLQLDSTDVPEELTVDSVAPSRDSTLPKTDSTFKPMPTERTIGDIDKNGLTKDPYTAMYWSIIPGGGQFYNEDYLKSGLFFASASVLTGVAIMNYSRFFPLQEQYDNNKVLLENMAEDDPDRLSIETENARLLGVKEVYRDNAHLSLFLLGISYFIATMDAYVGAHLYDFDVGEDSQAYLNLYPQPRGAMLSATYRF